ncbi:MAG: DUF5050 domain-containing protein [Oscillospiraceae bacterium]|nr:DUF5050 domain-containing protein [Oscillospiraceae bacterium]
MRVKRLTAALLCTAMLGGAADALAKDLIIVDRWAYNDVSNFNSEKLLPKSMESITDYRVEITRGQFCELLYSVLVKSMSESRSQYSGYFEDTDNNAINHLGVSQIVTGEDTGETEYGDKIRSFYPGRLLTREEMAVIMYRAMNRYIPQLVSGNTTEPSDISEVSDYAKEAVGKLLCDSVLYGTTDNKFEPKANLTIEQAITAVYKFYKTLPTAPYADGQNITGNTETEIQTYSNGLTETKKGNMLYLKNGGETLMQFETDVYTNIFSTTIGDTIYVIAQNVNGKADAYDVGTGNVLFTILYPIYKTEQDYIITKSSVLGPNTFGLYGYSGEEVLEPKYSLEEIEKLKVSDFGDIKQEYHAAEGWVYYADWSDEGHLYKCDSNGENKQKLSDNDCFNITYVDGWLYYSIRGEDENKLYTIKADGTHEQRVTDELAHVIACPKMIAYPMNNAYRDVLFAQTYDSENRLVYIDGWLYYVQSLPGDEHHGNIWRVKTSDDGVVKEKVSDINVLYRDYAGRENQLINGKLYFTEYDGKIGGLYCTDGTEVKCICDKPVECYGIYDECIAIRTYEDDAYHLYITDENGENPHEWEITEEIKAQGDIDYSADHIREDVEYTDENGNRYEKAINHEMSDDEHTVYWLYRLIEFEDGSGAYGEDDGLFVEDSDGTVHKMQDGWSGGFFRIDDMLFYPTDEVINGRIVKSIWKYNMSDGAQEKIVPDIRNSTSWYGDDWFIYADNNFVYWRYDIKTGTSTEIYPNAGTNPYGKLKSIHSYDGSIVKIDTDGNMTAFDTGSPHYMIYIENGKQL